MATNKTCDKCKNYTAAKPKFDPETGHKRPPDPGECSRIPHGRAEACPIDGLVTWDFYGYRSGCHVGPKFGCIHWEKKT